jgi:hypothetical protein
MKRKKSDRATKGQILDAARNILKKHFSPRYCLGFALLHVTVSPFDPEFGYWPVTIHRNRYRRGVGKMEFFWASEIKLCSTADEVKTALEGLVADQG